VAIPSGWHWTEGGRDFDIVFIDEIKGEVFLNIEREREREWFCAGRERKEGWEKERRSNLLV